MSLLTFSLTHGFSHVAKRSKPSETVSTVLRLGWETVKTVAVVAMRFDTGLKPGVNERRNA
jgi:hypothetical protein